MNRKIENRVLTYDNLLDSLINRIQLLLQHPEIIVVKEGVNELRVRF